MTRTSAAMLAALLVLGAARSASAEISEQGGELYSIEKRSLMGSHELMVSLGTLPVDAFDKGLTLYSSYTYHFSQLIAWEIVGGMWSFNFGTGLDRELKDRFDVQRTEEGELRWILNSNFVFKPLYGKLSLTNNRLFAGELFFVAGYALGGYTAAIPSGVDFGAALRMFVGRYFSVRLDLRDYMLLPDFKKLNNNIYVSLGLSLTFGFGDDDKQEQQEVEQ